MDIREANEGDIDGMSRVLDEIFAAKLRNTPGSRDFVRKRYLAHPDRLACTVGRGRAGADCRVTICKQYEVR